MSGPNPYGAPTPDDLWHEARIETAALTLALANGAKQRRAAFEELRRLVLARSDAQQARMAWDKGLPV